MNVLHVSAGAEKGGLEVVLLNILSCTDRSQSVPQVVLLDDGPFVKEVEATSTPTHVVPSGRVRDMASGGRAIAAIVRIIRQEGIHIVHSHNAKAHIYGGVAAWVAGVPSLYHLHGVPRLTASRDGIVNLLSVVVPAKRTIACSGYVADQFRRAWYGRRRPLVVMNGVLPRGSEVASDSVRKDFGIPEGVPVVVMATRLQRWKGVHVLLDAAAQVVSTDQSVHFIVVGGTLFGLERDYPDQLRQQIERLNLSGAVRLVGFQPDVLPFYRAADLVVHASVEPEPFGMVVLEALACGRPVIASDSGGPREIVESGVTGVLVPPNDATRLAQAILDLLGDPQKRVRMGQAGARRVQESFGAERMVQQLQTLYEAMVC